MTYPSLTPHVIDQPGAELTAREIAQQPSIWLKAAAGLALQADALRAFLDPLLRRSDLQIVLTGAGSSACIGECLAPALTRRLGMRVHAIATTDLVAAPDTCLAASSPVLLVSFARSGNSPESVAALDVAEQASAECHHLIITCNREGALNLRGGTSGNTHVVLLPDETNDRGFAMTSSFSTMMLAAALAFELIAPPAPATLGRWAGQLLADPANVIRLAHAGFERVVYLGCREFKGLAREAALKMLELTDGRVVAVSDTPLGFRHGPKTIITDKTLVVQFLCQDSHTRAYELDVLNELRHDGIAARVIALTAPHDSAVMSSDDICIMDTKPATDLELCFAYVMFAQTLALQQSLALGLKPDSPNARGVVNRVVQGVAVYPWNPPG